MNKLFRLARGAEIRALDRKDKPMAETYEEAKARILADAPAIGERIAREASQCLARSEHILERVREVVALYAKMERLGWVDDELKKGLRRCL